MNFRKKTMTISKFVRGWTVLERNWMFLNTFLLNSAIDVDEFLFKYTKVCAISGRLLSILIAIWMGRLSGFRGEWVALSVNCYLILLLISQNEQYCWFFTRINSLTLHLDLNLPVSQTEPPTWPWSVYSSCSYHIKGHSIMIASVWFHGVRLEQELIWTSPIS